MATQTVTAFGWELHNFQAGHDKFYRILLIDQIVLFNWGARGARGQFSARKDRSEIAQRVAAEQTDAKAAKGYRLSRDMTPFEVPTDIAEILTSQPEGQLTTLDLGACAEIVAAFKRAADQMGTATSEASR